LAGLASFAGFAEFSGAPPAIAASALGAIIL
jgi:hypothetical protein